MLLYHYGRKPFPFLMTSRHTVKRTAEQIKNMQEFNEKIGREHGFLDHVSFFFEPIPQDLGSLYASADITHKTWYPGAELYQHVVDTSSLYFGFEIVETKEQWEFMNKNWKTSFGSAKNFNDRIEYFKQETAYKRQLGHLCNIGNNSAVLDKAAKPYSNGIREAYLATIKNEEKDVLANYYAPNVPHVMLFTLEEKIKLISKPTKLILK